MLSVLIPSGRGYPAFATGVTTGTLFPENMQAFLLIIGNPDFPELLSIFSIEEMEPVLGPHKKVLAVLEEVLCFDVLFRFQCPHIVWIVASGAVRGHGEHECEQQRCNGGS